MGTEADIPAPESQEPPQASATTEPGEKPRRRSRKTAQALPGTEMGERVADQVQRKLIEMVNAVALTEANRRRATAIDATDYEKAFDLIAGPAKRENAVAIVADVATAAGTGLIGYAINVYTGSAPERTHGHLAMIGGILLLVLGIVLKYVMQRT